MKIKDRKITRYKKPVYKECFEWLNEGEANEKKGDPYRRM
jgi:hypothetical protein